MTHATTIAGPQSHHVIVWDRQAGLSVSGRVLDDAGMPTAQAYVYLRTPQRTGRRPSRQVRTGEDGSFSFDDVAVGAHVLTVLHPVCAPYRTDVHVDDHHDVGRIQLTRAAELEIIDCRRRRGVEVLVEAHDDAGWSAFWYGITNHRGGARLAGLAAGSYRVTPAGSPPQFVDLEAGETHRVEFACEPDVRIRLIVPTPPPPGTSVNFRGLDGSVLRTGALEWPVVEFVLMPRPVVIVQIVSREHALVWSERLDDIVAGCEREVIVELP